MYALEYWSDLLVNIFGAVTLFSAREINISIWQKPFRGYFIALDAQNIWSSVFRENNHNNEDLWNFQGHKQKQLDLPQVYSTYYWWYLIMSKMFKCVIWVCSTYYRINTTIKFAICLYSFWYEWTKGPPSIPSPVNKYEANCSRILNMPKRRKIASSSIFVHIKKIIFIILWH